MLSGNQAHFTVLRHCLPFSWLWDGCNRESVLWLGGKKKHKGVKLQRNRSAKSVRLSQKFQLATFTYVSVPELHHMAIPSLEGTTHWRRELWMGVQSSHHTPTASLMIGPQGRSQKTSVEHIAYYNVCPSVVTSLERLKDFPGDDTGDILSCQLARRESNLV